MLLTFLLFNKFLLEIGTCVFINPPPPPPLTKESPYANKFNNKKEIPKFCGFLNVILLFYYLFITFNFLIFKKYFGGYIFPLLSLIHKINFYCTPIFYRLNLQNTVFVLVRYACHCVDMHHNVELCTSFWLAARDLLYAPSHRQNNAYHSPCYTSSGAVVRTRNSSVDPRGCII